MKKMYFLIIIILLISGHLSSVSINIYAYIDWYGTVFEDGGNYFYVQNVNQGLKVGKAWGATSDYYRSFFCFDITSIPYNAEINSVILHANRYSVSAGNTHLTDVLGLDIYSNPGLPPEEMHNKISSGNLYVDNWDFMQLQYMYYPNEYEIDLGPNAIGDLELFLTYQFDFFPIGFKETGDNSTYGAINQNYTYCTINYTVPDPANLSLSNITIPNPVPYIGGSYTAQINNTGDGELYFAIDNLPSWVIINYNPDPIPGGSYTPININVEPNQSNNRSCSIRFYNTANQNNEEFLIINQEGQPINSLTNGSVTPNPGTTDDTFEFSVIFQSPAGQSPSDVTLHLDGATYSMNAQGSNWQNGVEFIKNISSLNQGNHSFYFTANNNDLRYPISGNLNLNVTQSAVGWDIAINVPNSSLSPNNIEPGDDITATVGVSNPGQFTYNNVPILVELRDPDGNLIDSENSQTGIVEPNQVYTFDLVVHLPSNSDDGLYSVILSLLPELDCNPSNNSHTLQFYIGGMIDTDQYIVEWGDLLTGGDYFYISGYQYHLYGAYSSSNEILVFDPYGDDEIIIENEIEFFNIGPAEQVIVNEGVFAQAGPDLAYLTVGHAVASGGPQFSSVEVLGYRGESIYFNATASSGCQFENNAGNYDCWTSSDDGNNYVDDWFNGVSSNTGYVTADFEFIIPSNASYGTHTFYFQTDYEDSGDPKYITKLKITILHSSPSIASLSSYEFSADDYITISGNDFSSVGQVFFGSLETSNITSWSNTSIVCEVPENVVNGNLYVVTNYGISNSVYYQIISSTGNPEIIQPIPDQEIIAGTSAIISDLNNVFWDPNNDVLQYAINYSSSYLTYNADSLIIGRLFMEAEDNVEEDVTISVTATDADSVSIEDIFILSIQDINDPPSIDPIPDQTFNEDESLTLDYGYFNSYVTDPDNSFEELILDIVDYGDLIIQNTGTQFIISAPADWFGFSTPLLSVSDGEYVTTMVFNITVLPINDPPILNISINCELYEDSLVVYNFYEFCDQTWGESDSLYLLSTSSTHIDVYIDDFFVTFVSNEPDWNGTEDITFYLDDNITEGACSGRNSFVRKSHQSMIRDVVSQTVPVTIIALEDDPTIVIPVDSLDFFEDGELIVDFEPWVYDPDPDVLTLSVTGNDSIIVDITDFIVTFSA
ncbi:MAG: IPT/TIG domain-containing protein, partial [Candidatus Stygibacter australis]|nr:IPT/TIG domain-containing protein [Candidatus Stygibacter australis]